MAQRLTDVWRARGDLDLSSGIGHHTRMHFQEVAAPKQIQRDPKKGKFVF